MELLTIDDMRMVAEATLPPNCPCGCEINRCVFCGSTKIRYYFGWLNPNLDYLFCWACYVGMGLRHLDYATSESDLFEIWSWVTMPNPAPTDQSTAGRDP